MNIEPVTAAFQPVVGAPPGSTSGITPLCEEPDEEKRIGWKFVDHVDSVSGEEMGRKGRQ